MPESIYPTEDAVEISLLLRIKREQKGWSIDQASQKTGIPAKYLEDIENNTFRSFVGKAAVLESYLRVYSTRLNVNHQSQKALLDFARNLLLPGKFNFQHTSEFKRGQ